MLYSLNNNYFLKMIFHEDMLSTKRRDTELLHIKKDLHGRIILLLLNTLLLLRFTFQISRNIHKIIFHYSVPSTKGSN